MADQEEYYPPCPESWPSKDLASSVIVFPVRVLTKICMPRTDARQGEVSTPSGCCNPGVNHNPKARLDEFFVRHKFIPHLRDF